MTKDVIPKDLTYYEWVGGSTRSKPEGLLVPGIWTDQTPSIPGFGSIDPEFGFDWVIDSASEPGVFYACCDQRGLWRSEDNKATWSRVGTPPEDPYDYSGHTEYIDSPTRVLVNPADGNHLILTQGVRGQTVGFWVSRDRGATWDIPAGFASIASGTTTNDVTTMEVDPDDFDHILLGSHSPWQGSVVAGIMETEDGGDSWEPRAAPGTWPGGSHGIGIIDFNTWIVMTDGDGTHRTTNRGVSWTKVDSGNAVHHGCMMWKAPSGRLWIGGQPRPKYSDDDGETWTEAADLPAGTYYAVIGDDNERLYASIANTGDNGIYGPQPYYKSDNDGEDWEAFNEQEFEGGPFNMIFVPATREIVSSNWLTGILTLKVAA